jgi:hypothetical protein
MDTIHFLVFLGVRVALAWVEDRERRERKEGDSIASGQSQEERAKGEEKRAECRKSQAKRENEKECGPRTKGGYAKVRTEGRGKEEKKGTDAGVLKRTCRSRYR